MLPEMPYWFYRWGFFMFIPLTFVSMEAVSDQPPLPPDPLAVQKKRVEDAATAGTPTVRRCEAGPSAIS